VSEVGFQEGKVVNITTVWERIQTHGGQLFHTVRGIPFEYHGKNNYIILQNTLRNIPRSDFAKALPHLPLSSTAEAQSLGVQGPAYLYAILMDPRIRLTDW
jgi:hypothetical protein